MKERTRAQRHGGAQRDCCADASAQHVEYEQDAGGGQQSAEQAGADLGDPEGNDPQMQEDVVQRWMRLIEQRTLYDGVEPASGDHHGKDLVAVEAECRPAQSHGDRKRDHPDRQQRSSVLRRPTRNPIGGHWRLPPQVKRAVAR
jgi:hypothetical protein